MVKVHIDKQPEILAKYKNGNYWVTLYNDGTKIKENDLDFLEADFPESFDCKITNYCPMNCPMCHEKSNIHGKHGDILNLKFFDTLHHGTEIAIGGGLVTSHPDLVPFLRKLKTKGVFPSITVHQIELDENWDLIKSLLDEKLIYGLGVSYHHKNDELWDKILKEIPTAVVHLIGGYHKLEVFKELQGHKILVLGYKQFGRGEELYEELTPSYTEFQFNEDNLAYQEYINKAHPILSREKELENWLFDNLDKFKVVSFDNLALDRLNVRSHIGEELWNEFYQGEDGTHTMYIDAVKEEFAKTSTSKVRYNILDNVDKMFSIIKKEK